MTISKRDDYQLLGGTPHTKLSTIQEPYYMQLHVAVGDFE